MAKIPDDPSALENIFQEMKQNMQLGTQKEYKVRKQAISNILKGLNEMKEEFKEAFKQDLGYNSFTYETMGAGMTVSEVQNILSNFKGYMKPESVPTTLTLGMATSSIEYEPLGLVLVISAWNYPLYTAIPLVAAAISAGNSVILKPSECAPYTSNCLKALFDKYLDDRFYRVIEGKVEIAKAISKLPFDMVCFTGSTTTGRLVAIEAAKNLTPCLLELGGKCPVIVDETAKLDNAAMRLLTGKFMNCGQTCIGCDHVYVHESQKEAFKLLLLEYAQKFYGNGQNLKQQGFYGKIINDFHTQRLLGYLQDQHKGKIIYGGNVDKDRNFIGPTIIEEPKKDCKMMKDEIFGPLMPLFFYNNLDDVITEINSRSKPLAVYLFSENSSNIKAVKDSTSSGAFVVNEALLQITNPNLPFGGVGGSGYGRYHGKHGFVSFSNAKSVCYTKAMNSYPVNQRYPPYNEAKQKTFLKILNYGHITYGQIGRAMLLSIVLITAISIGCVLLAKEK